MTGLVSEFINRTDSYTCMRSYMINYRGGRKLVSIFNGGIYLYTHFISYIGEGDEGVVRGK